MRGKEIEKLVGRMMLLDFVGDQNVMHPHGQGGATRTSHCIGGDGSTEGGKDLVRRTTRISCSGEGGDGGVILEPGQFGSGFVIMEPIGHNRIDGKKLCVIFLPSFSLIIYNSLHYPI